MKFEIQIAAATDKDVGKGGKWCSSFVILEIQSEQ